MALRTSLGYSVLGLKAGDSAGVCIVLDKHLKEEKKRERKKTDRLYAFYRGRNAVCDGSLPRHDHSPYHVLSSLLWQRQISLNFPLVYFLILLIFYSLILTDAHENVDKFASDTLLRGRAGRRKGCSGHWSVTGGRLTFTAVRLQCQEC